MNSHHNSCYNDMLTVLGSIEDIVKIWLTLLSKKQNALKIDIWIIAKDAVRLELVVDRLERGGHSKGIA